MFGRLAMGVSGCVAAIGALRLSWPTSRDALEARRDRRLRRLVGHAYRTVPYYRRLFDEAGLKPEGLTLRHFPQSFAMATLGGMIATRSGGHFATLYTHIDDFVESTRTVTPSGVMESRRLPGSGAGPSPDRLMLGSEGALGIITEAWMRLQDRPTFRASTAVNFPGFQAAAEAVRALTNRESWQAALDQGYRSPVDREHREDCTVDGVAGRCDLVVLAV